MESPDGSVQPRTRLGAADDDEPLPREMSEDVDLEVDPLLVGEPVHGQPEIPDPLESIPFDVDRWMDDRGFSRQVARDPPRNVLAVRDDPADARDRGLVPPSARFDPAAGGPSTRPREGTEESLPEIVEHPDRGVAVPKVRPMPGSREHGPVARDDVEVVVRDRRPLEGAHLPVLARGRSTRHLRDLERPHVRHARAGRQRGVEVRDVQVRIESPRQGERDSLAPSDEVQVVMEDRDPHGPREMRPSTIKG